MGTDLFSAAQKENFIDRKVQDKDFYDKVKEQRQRPMPAEAELVSEAEERSEHSIPDMPKAVLSEKPIVPEGGFDFDEATRLSAEYFKGDDLAAKVWVSKYALKDIEGKLHELTPDVMHRRIARELARVEMKYPNPMSEELIYGLLKEFKYIIPQGSPMSGIGNTFQVVSLSNCFVIGNEGASDSYGAILKVDQEQVQLMKRRGGVGHDLSHIRPYNSPVMNSALRSTGIVPFMERYSNSTREVAQDGRRGALMLTVSVKHPDAENFIDAKVDTTKVTGANVSVKLTDEFMRAVVSDSDFVQQFPVNAANPEWTNTIRARDLWKKVVHNAWKSAEPGILFWDTVIKESIPDCYADQGFETVSTNPCGEIPLCPYDSCRLLAINLYSYVDNPFTPEASFNSDRFSQHVRYAMRMMDDIIDLELEKIERIIAKIDKDPEPEDVKAIERNLWLKIREKAEKGRRTGLGITAEGDMLAALGTRYGTEQATSFSVEVHKLLALEAYSSSVTMASERGPFPLFNAEREKNNPFIQRIKEAAPGLYDDMLKYGRRNIAMLTIAPTGTTSLMTQTSSGLEPAYLISYKRRRKVNPNDKDVKVSFVDKVGDAWEEYNVFHHKFITWLRVNGYDVDEVSHSSDAALNEIIAQSPYYKATANDIDWLTKVKMQGAVQKWVDHSISVTVNVPENTAEELIGEIYLEAWNSGCKGMTVYRDGSRTGVLVSSEEKKKKDSEFSETEAPKRPDVLPAEIVRFQNDYEKWIAFVGLYKGRPYEIFTGKADDIVVPLWVEKGNIIKSKGEKGRSRYDFQYEDRQGYKVTMEGLSRSFDKEYWNYAKLISGILRHGMPLQFVVHVINTLDLKTDSITTWKNGIERALKKFIPDGTLAVSSSTCPKCKDSTNMVYQEGCLVCKSCGYSACS